MISLLCTCQNLPDLTLETCVVYFLLTYTSKREGKEIVPDYKSQKTSTNAMYEPWLDFGEIIQDIFGTNAGSYLCFIDGMICWNSLFSFLGALMVLWLYR
jgi:hypothetical protein